MIEDEVKLIAEYYSLSLKCIREDRGLFGSPERTNFRVVFEDQEEKLFVLEELDEKRLQKKQLIAETLGKFKIENPALKVCAYLENNEGQHISFLMGKYWQIQPYVEGIKLDRKKYLDEGWRAVAAAEFLLELKRASKKLKTESENIFSLKNYSEEIVEKIGQHNPDVLQKIENIVAHLRSGFFEKYEKLPNAFCHGDYHPLNIIWSEKNIASVIDWEFCGQKIELYDVANMVSCLGMENPSTLKKQIVTDFIAKLKESKEFQNESWENFVDLVLAIRFAWLSEWLRFKDSKMIQLEIDYMNLLLENREFLAKIWML